MGNATEYLLKAADAEREAELVTIPGFRDNYLRLAAEWRRLAERRFREQAEPIFREAC